MGTVRKLTGAAGAAAAGNRARKDALPFMEAGKGALGRIDKLMAGEIDLFGQPGVMKTFDAGAEALQRRMSASGFGGSGNELLGLADYTGNFTRSLYNDFFSQNMGMV